MTVAAFADTGPDIFAGIGEVIAAGATREVEAAQPAPVARPDGAADDLARIKGVGPKLVALLGQLGITRFAQIAAWTEEEIASLDKDMKLMGRIGREAWIAQARRYAGA